MSDSTAATCQEGERENVGIFMCNWKDILACTLICFKLTVCFDNSSEPAVY